MSLYDLNAVHRTLRRKRPAPKPANLYDLNGVHAVLREQRAQRLAGGVPPGRLHRVSPYDAGLLPTARPTSGRLSGR